MPIANIANKTCPFSTMVEMNTHIQQNSSKVPSQQHIRHLGSISAIASEKNTYRLLRASGFVFVLIRESFFLQYLKGEKNGAFTFYNYHFKICRMVSFQQSSIF
jgi:hypothetical protein